MPPGIRPRKLSSPELDKNVQSDEKSTKTGVYIGAAAIVILLAVTIYFW